MAKIPVKLTRGEIVVSPQVYQQHKARIEAMNKEGLLARNMGGVAAYRAQGGAVYRQEGGPATQKFLGQDVPVGSIGKIGQSLIAIDSRDWKGAADALTPDKIDPKTKGDIEKKLNELDRLLASGQITQAQYDRMKNELLQGSSSGEKKAIQAIVEKAAKSYSLVDPASAALKFVRERLTISTADWATVYAGIAAGGDPSVLLETLTGQADLQLTAAAETNPEMAKSEIAYTELKAYLTEMTSKALEAQGGGVKTDFDFEVAERSVANLSSSDASIKNSMKRVLDSAKATASIEGWADFQVPDLIAGVKITVDGTDGPDKPDASVTPENLKDGQRFADNAELGPYYYVYNEEKDVVIQENDNAEWELGYNKDTKKFYIENWRDTFILTPLQAKAKRKGGLIAW